VRLHARTSPSSGRAEGRRRHEHPRGSRRDLGAVLLGTVACGLPVFLVGTMAVQVRHSLRFGAADLGLAVGAYYLGAAMSSVPGSWLAEAVGGARVMRAILVLSGAVQLAIASAASSWTLLSALLFLAGALSGIMNPGTNLFLARRSAVDRQGFAFGIKQSAVPFASLLGGLAVPAVALTVGWRWAFVLAGMVAFGASWTIPASRTSLAERRRQQRLQPRAEVHTAALAVLAVGLGMGILAASGCVAFLVSSAVHIGYQKGTAGLIVALASVVALVCRIASGVQADRRGARHFGVISTMMAVGVAGYAALAAGAALGDRPLFAAGAIVALGIGWGWNGLFNFAVVRSHADTPAVATGVTQVGGRLGGVFGPVVIGVVVAHGSYAEGWLVAAGAALCGAGVTLAGARLLSRAARASAAALSA
jgi:MFS family permease